MKLLSRVESLMEDAIVAHVEAGGLLRKSKERLFDCGLFLLSAHAIYSEERPGEWLTYLDCYSERIRRSTAYRYMRFAQDCLDWAILNEPRLKDQLAIQKAARDMILQSGLSFLDLMRELSLVKSKEAGGRASDKHKTTTPEQLAFNFSVFDDSLWALERAGAAVLKTVAPEDLQSTRTRLETALHLVTTELTERASSLSAPGRGLGEVPSIPSIASIASISPCAPTEVVNQNQRTSL